MEKKREKKDHLRPRDTAIPEPEFQFTSISFIKIKRKEKKDTKRNGSTTAFNIIQTFFSLNQSKLCFMSLQYIASLIHI